MAGGSQSAGWADYAGEGRPSLLLAGEGEAPVGAGPRARPGSEDGQAQGPAPTGASPSRLRLLTLADGKLRDDSQRIPPRPARAAESAVWIDANGDGLPDLLIAWEGEAQAEPSPIEPKGSAGASPSRHGEHGFSLFENTGRGPEWFRDVTDRVGLGRKALPPEAVAPSGGFLTLGDYDGDGYTDFFYSAGPGLLFHNERGRGFRLDTKSGIDLPGAAVFPRAAVFADYDNDGNLDLLVPGPTGPRLYHNNNDGTFTDVTASSGDLAQATGPCLTAAWGDVNHDGFLDLYVCFPATGGRLYLGDGRGHFRDVTTDAGLDRLRSVLSASFADVDGDGRLDLLLDLGDKAVLAVNEMDAAPNCGSLTVRASVRKGLIGAVVRVQDARGRPMGLRTLASAEGWGGQASPAAHFGLPAGRYRVSVCLTDGRVAEREVTIEPKAARLSFVEGEFR